MPNLIEVQKNSYEWFLTDGLKEVFDDVSPIGENFSSLSLEFGNFRLCRDEIKYTIEEDKVSGYTTTITGDSEKGFTVENYHKYSPPPEPAREKFGFTKIWQDDESHTADDFTWKLYDKNGKEVHKGFKGNTVKKNKEYYYYKYFTDSIEGYYLIENVPAGYQAVYENVGAYAGITDRCYNGGTITNVKKAVPKTGDNSNVVLWTIMALAGLATAGSAAFFTRKRKAQKR